MSGFRQRWAELTKEGWRSRPPTGLSNDYTYLKPGKTKKDMRGSDYFVGEEELMRYLDRLDLEAARKASQTPPIVDTAQSSGCDAVVSGTEASFEQQAPPNVSSAAGEEVDVPAGDTPPRNVADSPSIASDSAASEGGSVPPTLRYESPHVTQPAGRPLADSSGSEYSPSPRRNLRDAFAGEMERGHAEDYALGTEEKESDREELYTRAEAAPDRSSGIAAVLSDVNILQTEENLDEFTALVSDAENDDGASDGESSEAESNAYEDIALEESDSNEEAADALFDEMLLESAGGIAGIAGGNINADILKDMGTSGWTEPVSYSPYPYLDEPFEARDSGAMANEFPGLYGGDYGPTTRALEAASTAIDIFFYFVQPQLWEDIAAASNEYFMEQLDERVEGQYKKQEARERKQPDYN